MAPITRQALKSPRTVDMKDTRGANRDLQAQKRLEGRFAIQMLGRMANVPEVSDSIQKGMRADYWLNIARRKMRRMLGLDPAGPTENNSKKEEAKEEPSAKHVKKAQPRSKPKTRDNKPKATPAKSKARPAKTKARPAKSKARRVKSKARSVKSKARSGKNKGKKTVNKKAPKSWLYKLVRGGKNAPVIHRIGNKTVPAKKTRA